MKKVEFTQTVLNEMSRFKFGKQQLAFKILELIEDIRKIPLTAWASLKL